MADKKISELPLITTISGSIVYVPIVHDGITEKITVEDFSKFTNKYAAQTGSVNIFTANQTITANLSVGGTSTLTGNTSIGGNLVVNGKLTAQEVHTEITSASIIFESGSTIFGNTSDDTHQFTGIVSINGTTIGAQALNDFTASTNNQLQRVYQTTSSLNIQTGSQNLVNLRISSTTGSINTTTSSFDSVFLRISSTTGSINTTTASFNSVFLGISSVTGALNTFTQSFNYVSGSYATTGSNTFRGNQSITGSLSVSAGEFNVTTGSGNMTSSLIFDHTQNDGVTLGLRHNDRLSVADHTFNVNVWAGGVYTTFVRNGSPYSILNVEAFDDNKIYIYRDTRLYNKSLVIDNNLTVTDDAQITGSLIVLGGITGSLLSTNGVISSSNQLFELNAFTGSVIGQTNTISTFTSSVNFTTQSLNTQTGSQNSISFNISVVTSSIDAHILKQATQTGSQDLVNYQNSIITSSYRIELNSIEAYTSSLKNAIVVNGSNVQIVGSLDVARLNVQYVSSSVLVTSGSNVFGDASNDKHEFTGSVNIKDTLFVNGQAVGLGELNAFSGSQIGKDFTLSVVTSSIDAHILKQSTQTGSQDLVNYNISVVTSSINAHILKQATQTGSQDLVNLGISTFTGSLRSEVNLIEAYTASLKSQAIVSSSTQVQNYDVFALNSNLYNGTGSLIGITNGLMALTASMKSQAIVSSSQQVQNYFTFAKTGSANTFYGNQTITGSVAMTGSLRVGDWIGGSPHVDETARFDVRTTVDRGIKITGNVSSDVIITAYRGASDDLVRGMRLQGNGIGIYIGDGNANTGSSVASFNTNGLAFENGKGIDFSATSNGSGTTTSELLNDYEEGSFTPVIAGGTTAGTATYTDQNGKYTKIGNCVHFRMDVIWSGHTGTGTLKITGLPFTIGQNYQSVGSVRFNQSGSANHYIAGGFIYQTQFELNQIPVGGGTPASFDITSVGDIRVSGHYFV